MLEVSVGHRKGDTSATPAACKEQLLGQSGFIAEGTGCFVPMFTGTEHTHERMCSADGLGLVLELSDLAAEIHLVIKMHL